MSDSENSARSDGAHRFLFEAADIRGETVQLHASLGAVLGSHQYATGVERLLGEFLAASVLLANTLKFDGQLTLQARSSGQIPLIMADCTSELDVRAIARGAQTATADDFATLLDEGQLAITIDPSRGRRYQGIVPLMGDSLAASLDNYFEQSEQLHTRLWLACDGERAAGMLLQQLPSQVTLDPLSREQQWERVCTLGHTLTAEELLTLPPEIFLHRLFHEDRVRLFEPRPVRFRCSCSRERSLRALASLPEGEIAELLAEQGSVTMDCEFCNQRYVFLPEDLPGTTESSQTVH
jgi:molecular chaperone Hsp33